VSGILLIDSDTAFCARMAHALRVRGKVSSVSAIGEVSFGAYPSLELILLGIDLQSGSACDQIRTLRAGCPNVPTLLLASRTTTTALEEALRAGALGCVLKSDLPAEWENAIDAAVAGKLYVSDSIAPALLRHVLNSTPSPARSGVEGLTDRELMIFQMIGSGCRISDIAGHLKLSSKTVECHREKIKHRLGLANSAALLHFASLWMNQQSSVPSVGTSCSSNEDANRPVAGKSTPKSP
jgi:DNA-binding NarL/FixJ family response regulator